MKIAYQVLIIQLSIMLFATAGWVFLLDKNAGISAIAAAVCCLIPNLLFARWLFSHSGARAVPKIIQAFYFGEMLKIAATVILFVVCIKYIHVQFLPFMGTYVLCQLAFWLAPWLGSKNRVRSV